MEKTDVLQSLITAHEEHVLYCREEEKKPLTWPDWLLAAALRESVLQHRAEQFILNGMDSLY